MIFFSQDCELTLSFNVLCSQPIAFVEKFVWIQLWLSIYINILNVTYQAVMTWWQLMQGVTREMQMLNWGFTLTLSSPLSPSLLVFCGNRAQVCTWQIRDGILDALPVTLSSQGWELVHRAVMDQTMDNISLIPSLTPWGKAQPYRI